MKLICYLSNGYPTIEASIQMADHYIDAGCDVLEVDFPSRNPYLEGEYIASRMAEALKACDDYQKYMEGIVKIKKKHPDKQFILMAYEDTILEIGVEAFARFCRENDLMDLIYVGLKDEAIKAQLIERGIRVSCYVQFHMPEAEINSAKASNGFVYMQGKPTSVPADPQYPALKDCIARLKSEGIDRSIYCGVGIHTPEDVAMAKAAGADGVFIGSAILRLHEDIPKMKRTISEFKAKAGE